MVFLLGNDIAVYPIISLHEIINWNPTMLLIKGAKTMFIIVFTMILIVATMIYIVFTKIGNVLKHLKYIWVNCYIIAFSFSFNPTSWSLPPYSQKIIKLRKSHLGNSSKLDCARFGVDTPFPLCPNTPTYSCR